MKELTATDIHRHFTDVLNAVESRRESFLVLRHGRPIATISPAAPASGRRLKQLLAEHRPDPEWARELDELRSALVEPAPAWND